MWTVAIPTLHPGLLLEQIVKGEHKLELLWGVLGQCIEYAGNEEGLLLIKTDRLADDIVGPVKKLPGQVFGDDDGLFILQPYELGWIWNILIYFSIFMCKQVLQKDCELIGELKDPSSVIQWYIIR